VQDIVTDFWSAEVATLSQSVFQLLGGTGFFRSLMRVGLVAAGSEGVPLVEPLHREDLESSLRDLQKAYEEARPHFLSEGESLCSLLERTTSLNRTSYAVRAVQRDYLEYCAYFERGESSFGHPDSARFTQRKVDAAIKKNTLPLSHPLLLHLERLYDANARVKVAARELEDSLRYRLCQIVRDCVGKEHARTRTQSFDGLLKDFYSAL